MAPEQVWGETATGSIDTFALGVIRDFDDALHFGVQ